jgi:benzoyl-CoA reductase/2-hydroxyglutaryl-CoA dehydratase subunit BcrC/BadD/HgdB
MVHYYDGMLKLCGFEDDELNKERSRIEKVFQKIGLESEDMKEAERWVRENQDVELMGVRKLLGIWLKELIDLVLAKDEGKKVVYYGFPTIAGPAAAIASASDKVLACCPDAVLLLSLGQIFNKIIPIFEAGEENGLPAGHALCGLQQIRLGALVKGIIPVPDLVLTSSYFCDMGSKADELLHEKYGHPAIYIDGSMDSRWGEFPDYLPKRLEFLGGQLNKALDSVKDILGVEVTDKARREGASRSRELFGAIGEMYEILRDADPQPISIVPVELTRRLGTGSASRRMITEGPEVARILNKELRERMERGIGVVEKGAPKVLITIAHYSDPRIMHMIENSGLHIVGGIYGYMQTAARKPTSYIDGKILAEVEFGRGMFHSGYGVVKRAQDAAVKANVDGIIWSPLFNCRPLGMPSHLLKQVIEKETGIPVLGLESDPYDSRTYSAEALRTRVETFADMLRARKASVKA